MKFSFRCFVFIATASTLLVFAMGRTSVAEEPRLWTSSDNMFKINATLISVTKTDVKLKRSDNGKEISVPIAKLSEADRTFIESHSTNQTSQQSSNQTDAKQKSNTSIPKLTLQPIDASSYRLDPLGMLTVPAPGFLWAQVSGRSVQSFQATKEGNPNC